MAGSIQQLQFGAGIVFATPQGGDQPTNPTPVEVGVLQNVKVTLGADIKTLYGQLQYPVDSAVGKRSIKGSFSFALIELLTVLNVFAGNENIVSGRKALAYREPDVVAPPVNPAAWAATHAYTVGQVIYDGAHVQQVTIGGTSGASAPAWNVTVGGATAGDGGVTWKNIGSPLATVTVQNSATVYALDLGVRYAATGIPLVKVASNPASGQYSAVESGAGAGVYSFAPTDAGVEILISYKYNDVTGRTLQMTNKPMGVGPVIGFHLVEPYQSSSNGMYLPNVRVGKMDGGTKLDDYAMNDSDFEAFALPSGLVAEMYSNT